MPFVDDAPNPQSNPPPADDDLYAPFQGANGMGKAIEGAPLDVGPTAWSDIPKAVVAGGHGVAADAAGFVSATAEGPQTAQSAKDFAAQQEQAQHDTEQTMSPAAQRPGFLSHPLVSTAEAAPGIAALAVPAALSGPFAPLVVSGLMGAQGLGGAQNRAADQGVTLTPAEKAEQFGIGAATGLVPELGVAGKIAVSPLVKSVLSGGVDAAAFGVGAAAGETVSQQGEIGAGKRQGYDPSAIVSAAETGAEQGAGFGVTHLFHGNTRLPEGGVSAEPTRSETNYRKPGVLGNAGKPPADASAPADKPADAASAAPPPPPPKVDPAQAAALNPQSVTPRVSEQPKVVQPEPVVATPAEAPQRIEEPSATTPAAQPTDALPARPDALQAAPKEDAGAIVPESGETLQAQHAALLDPGNTREAMLYPKGSQVFDLPDKTFGQIKLPDGRIVQYDKDGPSGFTAAKIRQYAKDDRLNEALQLGPVSKDEAIARASAGEPGAVVTERTSDGVPVKEAVGTTVTAPEQAASLEATKTPGSTVQVERPEDTLAERVQPQSSVVQPERVVTPEGKAPVVPTGRVLEAQDPESIRARDAAAADDARQAQTVAEQLKAKEAAKQAVTAGEAGEKQRSHKGKLAISKIAKDNEAARRVAEGHPFKQLGANWVNDTYDRANAMVKAGREADINVPLVFKEGHPYDPAMLKLREAHDLVTKDGKPYPPGKYPTNEKYSRFLTREKMIDDGKAEEAFAIRRAEGKEGKTAAVEGSEGEKVIDKNEAGTFIKDADNPENELIRKQEAEQAGEDDEGTDGRDERWDLTPDASRGDILRKIEAAKAIARDQGIGGAERANAMRGVERLQEALRAGEDASKPTDAFSAAREERERKLAAAREESEALRKEAPAPKAAMGFQVAKVKSRAIKRQEGEGELTTDKDGNPMEVKPTRTQSAKEALDENFDVSRYAPHDRPGMERLRDQIEEQTDGTTPVHYVSKEDMTGMADSKTLGAYDPDEDKVFINKDNMGHDTVLHELFHAATFKSIESSPQLKGLLNDFHAEVKYTLSDRGDLDPATKHALSDPHELLTGLMTNDKVKADLKGVKISPDLARRLEIPKWRKMTLYEGALNLIRKALGMGPRDVPAIEAAMNITDRAIWKRDPGQAMEAMARGSNADRKLYQKMTDPEAMHEDEKQMPSRLRDMGESVGKAAFDAKDNLSAGALRKLPRWMNGVELSRSFGKMFTDKDGNVIEGILGLNRRKGAELAKRTTDDADIISKAHVLADKHPDFQEAVSKLEHDATKFNVRAEDEPAPIKGDPHSKGMENWGHNAHAPNVHEQFNALPKELQDFHIEKRDFYGGKAKEVANQHIDMVLDNFPLPAGETRASTEAMIRDKNLSDDAKEHYENLGMLEGLQDDQRKLDGKKVYFNGVRDGDHVVLAKNHMPEGGSTVDYSGGKLPENVREFATREEAHAYETGTDMYGTTKSKFYFEDPNKPGHYITELTDPSTGKIVKASSTEYDERRYQTTLQHEHYEAYNSPAEAKRGRQKLIDNGLHSVSDVLNKRMEGNWGRINSDAGQAMERRIKDRTDLNSDQKRGMIDAARAYSLVSRSGYQGHMMERRNIAGAKYNSADALRTYSNTVNRHIVNKQYAGRMDMLMKRLEDKDDANRYSGNDVGGISSAVANEIRERVYRSPDEMAAKNAPWVNRLQMTAYMRWLVGPRHLFMLQTHPYAYSAPQMAGRHGAGVYRMLHQAAKDMGGDFSGAKEGVKAAFGQARSMFTKDPEKAAELGATPDVTKDMIGRLKNDEEISAMNEGLNSGELHSGFGDEFYGASGLKKVDALVKQLSSAQDAQNRAIVYLTAFRAERAKGSSFNKSISYAKDIVQDTMGVHSSMDVASAMKNPLARMFMQFKQFPMRQIELMARNVYNGFKGETPEVKREAWKSFAHQVASGFTMAGVHGLPIGLLKPLGLLGMALGVTPSPSQIDDRMRRYVAGMIGSTGSNMLMDGALSAVPHAPDVSNMFSYDMDTMFGEPRGNDWKSYMADQVFGAAGSTLYDTGSGLNAAVHGDIGTALNKLPLPRVIPDFSKAIGLAQRGKTTSNGGQITPASYEDAAWRMLGFGTLQQARIQAGAEAAQADLQEQKTTKGEQLKAKQKAKQTIMGVPVTPKNRALLKEREQVYQ